MEPKRFAAGGWILFLLSCHSTAITATKTTTTRIAFGSCHKNRKATVPSIWEKIVMNDDDDNDERSSSTSKSLDAFVWMGDAMYPSHRDPVTGRKKSGPAAPQEIQKALQELKRNDTIGYTRMLDLQIPVYGTVDDHDFGGNDFGKHMPQKKERQQAFWEFLGYQPHDHEGMYHAIDIYENAGEGTGGGHVKLILLDTRSFRDDHCIPSVAHKAVPMGNAIACATRWLTAGFHLWKYANFWGRGGCEKAQLLGEAQWEWLSNELLNNTADLIIIVSSIQVWTTNPAMESWGQFPQEKERLWNLLQQHYAKHTSSSSSSSPTTPSSGPVIFLSGDVHHGEISGQEGYLEVTSSGLTHHCGEPFLYGHLCRPLLENFHLHRYRNDTFYIGLNYGIVQVDWQSRVATVQVKNALGNTVLQVKQPLDWSSSNVMLPPYQALPPTWDGHLIPWLQRLVVAILLAAVIAKRLFK